ncbi:MAG: glycosyltransferase family 4 protein [Candidatus Tectomicrobia bacterium]|nr:glycosyltransferase family 4 protein [Candidatus Tectomicrobia bacterium]
MATITIDALPLLAEGGISNYVRPFTHALLEQNESHAIRLLFRLGRRRQRRERYAAYRRRRPATSERDLLVSLPDRLVRLLWCSPWSLPPPCGAGRSEYFLATTELLPRWRRVRKVQIVYDLNPLRLPQFFRLDHAAFRRARERQAAACELIIAISRSTQQDVIELLRVPEEKTLLLYPGPPQLAGPAPEAELAVQPERPYILYIGALALNKNVDGLLRIFARCVHEHGLDYHLYLTGKDFLGEEFRDRLLGELRLGGRVHFLSWIPEAHLVRYLLEARMLWLFSWYEGFGLPVLEAACRGTPVLCSNRGSLPEILAAPEQLIDPDQEEEAAAYAARVCRDDALLAAWARRARERARCFSWERSAAALLAWFNAH